MISYIKLSLASLLPALMAVIIFKAEERSCFRNLQYSVKQLICGIAFGCLAILGTEWGIPIQGAQVNCRDGAVLTAGLLFGAPAGIIAGLIGGIERWFAVYWGVGTFTRVACTLSTIIAGFYSAVLRKHVLDDKRPSWLLAFTIGVVMEVFHITMIFITNMKTPEAAISVVASCTLPMVIANSFSVLISASALIICNKEQFIPKHEKLSLSQFIRRWLLVCIILVFSLTSFFVVRIQSSLALNQMEVTLKLALEDTAREIRNTSVQEVGKIAETRHIGETGYIVITDNKNSIVSAPEQFGSIEKLSDPELFIRTIKEGKYTINAVMSYSEAMRFKDISVYVNTFLEILTFALLFGLIYRLIDRTVVKQIEKVNASLGKIIEGNLDELVNVRSNAEFASLSDDINSTVSTLKQYIAKEAARIDKELEFAKTIQVSAVPRVFPVSDVLEIYASMDTAKEVGGDFYDFYQTKNTFNILIADVSGKGIPAAMFMMRAKTELKTLTEGGNSMSEIFTNGNNALCEGNGAGMFVTAWQGAIDLETGIMKCVNAGHNPPILCRKNGKFEFVRQRPSLVLAAMEEYRYKAHEMRLEEGDILFLYTDGVVEANNENNDLYGEDRLLEILNSRPFKSMKELCQEVKKDVDSFAGSAPQFDDITMLAFRYHGKHNYTEIKFDQAELKDIQEATDFVTEQLEKSGCPQKVIVQMSIAIDEIMSNIVKFAYEGKKGPATLRLSVLPSSVILKFIDNGVAYNPLKEKDPDTSLSADERDIGGLGIFMVKNTMTEMHYDYINHENILTLVKEF